MNCILKSILLFLLCIILCVASFGCFPSPGVQDIPADAKVSAPSQEVEKEVAQAPEAEVSPPVLEVPEAKKDVPPVPPEQENKPAENAPVPEAVQAEDEKEREVKKLCSLIVRCDTILKNTAELNPDKVGLIPADGKIFSGENISFNPGESVFNVLLREMKRNKIHLEFTNTPLYSSAYIEGINNIYEFDCGELSGWMYRVNGEFPGYGCSQYLLKPGDVVEWVYTCDLGRDVGGNGASIGGAGAKSEEG